MTTALPITLVLLSTASATPGAPVPGPAAPVARRALYLDAAIGPAIPAEGQPFGEGALTVGVAGYRRMPGTAPVPFAGVGLAITGAGEEAPRQLTMGPDFRTGVLWFRDDGSRIPSYATSFGVTPFLAMDRDVVRDRQGVVVESSTRRFGGARATMRFSAPAWTAWAADHVELGGRDDLDCAGLMLFALALIEHAEVGYEVSGPDVRRLDGMGFARLGIGISEEPIRRAAARVRHTR